jgi:outer membrane protein
MKFSFFSKLSSFLLPLTLSAVCFGSEAIQVPLAKPSPSPDPTRHFGVVDMQRIILTVEEGKEARAALEKEIKGKEEEFRKKKEALDKLNKEWKDQAPLLSEDARIRKQQDFQEKLVELRNSEMTFQKEISQKEGQATQRIAMKVTSLVDGLVRSQNIEAVFEVNSSGLLYLKNPIDLTEQVIKKYNETAKLEQKKSIGSSKEASKPTNDKKM